MARPKKNITNDASLENARLIVANAKLKEENASQLQALFDIEKIAFETTDEETKKKILSVISTIRNGTKGEN